MDMGGEPFTDALCPGLCIRRNWRQAGVHSDPLSYLFPSGFGGISLGKTFTLVSFSGFVAFGMKAKSYTTPCMAQLTPSAPAPISRHTSTPLGSQKSLGPTGLCLCCLFPLPCPLISSCPRPFPPPTEALRAPRTHPSSSIH